MYLILGAVLNAAAGFFWKGDGLDATGGTLATLGLACWMLGLLDVYQRLRPLVPWYATVAPPVTALAVTGGMAFSVQAVQEQVMDVPHAAAVALLDAYPVPAWTLYWICGPLFPLTVTALGAVLLRYRAAPVPLGVLLLLGGLVFPLSRITREVTLVHLADLLLLVGFGWLGHRTRRSARPVPAGRAAA
ncbi:hypothetical protein [Actinoplanes sp. NBRC 101535]|uniref:hypothetical protein n=1 Tax=Actinoplanes sp. NBRC 101535 TaxID=3032196 RepID=UPI00249FEEC9|nr:hypothetical protein [Actinoplanes sp. NBRC 101535]GLY04475.1 hypothetical protein Acsp01_48540 [Actinoplanes sp. NBRC 101535]